MVPWLILPNITIGVNTAFEEILTLIIVAHIISSNRVIV